MVGLKSMCYNLTKSKINTFIDRAQIYFKINLTLFSVTNLRLMPYTFFLNNQLLFLIPESFPVFAVGDGTHVGGHGFNKSVVDVFPSIYMAIVKNAIQED